MGDLFSDAVDRFHGRLTEREQREAPQEHTVIDPATGKRTYSTLTDDVVGEVQAGAKKLAPEDRYRVQMRDGTVRNVSGDLAQRLIDRGDASLLNVRGERRAGHEATLEEAYGGRPGLAAVQGLARSATGGVSDLIARGMGYEEAVAEVRKRSPRAALGGEIVGAVIPALATAGASTPESGAGIVGTALRSTPAGLAARAGEGIAARGAAGGLGVRTLARGAGGAAEGALFGAGTGVSELALSEDPITAERAVSVLSTRGLQGAALGGGIGAGATVVGAGVKKGVTAARGAVDRAAAKLKGAKPQATQVVDDLRAYHGQRGDLYLATEGKAKRVITTQGKAIETKLDDPIGLAESPWQVKAALRKDAAKLRETIANRETIAARLAKEEGELAKHLDLELQTLPASQKAVVLEGKIARRYADLNNVKLKRGGTVSLPVDDAVAFRRAIEAGETSGQRARSLANLDALLEQNQRIYAAIEDVTTKPGQGLGLGGQFEGAATRAVLGNIAGGPVGAVAAAVAPKVIDRIKSAVIERLGRASGEAADRVTTALDGVLAKGGTIASKARPTTTGILTRISYAAEAPAKAAKPSSTLEAFRAREQELRSITVGTPDGRLRMTRSARAQIAAGLREVAEVSPRMADQMETVAARKVEFLASKLPKRPDLMGLQTNWRPSDMDIAAFARSAQAAEDPASVFERVNDGSVTPEDAEALKAVYPEMFAEARAELLGSLNEIGGELSYERKLALSILYDVPVDPSMDPRVLRVLQGHFAENVVGGGSPPMPQPQSGSVSKSVDGATKAQQLSQPRGAGEGAGAS